MGSAITVIVILLVVIGILALVAMGSYNGFVKSRNLIQESWRQVDVELNRRYELLPNLVETVRGFAAHERNTLEDVTRLRTQAQQVASTDGSSPSQQRSVVEDQLSGAVRNLIVSVEAYPELTSNQNFLELQRQLTETEDRIAAGRRFYNANVRVYNTRIDSVPSNLIAGVFHFEKAAYFEVSDPAVRQAPSVSFGEIAYRGDQQTLPGGSVPQALPDGRSTDGTDAQQYQQPYSQPSPQPYGQYGQPAEAPQPAVGGYQPPEVAPPGGPTPSR